MALNSSCFQFVDTSDREKAFKVLYPMVWDACGCVGLQISGKLQVNDLEWKQRIVVLECFNWPKNGKICGSYETLDPRQWIKLLCGRTNSDK